MPTPTQTCRLESLRVELHSVSSRLLVKPRPKAAGKREITARIRSLDEEVALATSDYKDLVGALAKGEALIDDVQGLVDDIPSGCQAGVIRMAHADASDEVREEVVEAMIEVEAAIGEMAMSTKEGLSTVDLDLEMIEDEDPHQDQDQSHIFPSTPGMESWSAIFDSVPLPALFGQTPPRPLHPTTPIQKEDSDQEEKNDEKEAILGVSDLLPCLHVELERWSVADHSEESAEALTEVATLMAAMTDPHHRVTKPTAQDLSSPSKCQHRCPLELKHILTRWVDAENHHVASDEFEKLGLALAGIQPAAAQQAAA